VKPQVSSLFESFSAVGALKGRVVYFKGVSVEAGLGAEGHVAPATRQSLGVCFPRVRLCHLLAREAERAVLALEMFG
jgi:hypothetical protein